MPEYVVYDRDTGNVVYAYTADTATDFSEYPFQNFSHVVKKAAVSEAPRRRVTKLEFIARIGDAAFTKLLELSQSSVEIAKFVKMIDWATPDPDGTSIDLDDPRVQKIADLEPLLVSTGDVSVGWASEVLA